LTTVPEPPISWLPGWSEDALRGALHRAAPDLADRTLQLLPKLGAPMGIFCRSTARVGSTLMVKATWSREASELLLAQARLIQALGPLGLPLQQPILVSADPVLVLHRRLPGRQLTWRIAGNLNAHEEVQVAGLIGGLLNRLHDPTVLALVLKAGIQPPRERTWCQASDTSRLRRDLLPRLEPSLARRLEPRLDWVDHELADKVDDVFLHGDLHGHNLLFDPTHTRLLGVLDLESASVGDPAFDFRYLPGLSPRLELFDQAVGAYRGALLVERAWAWHLLTDLGDALWRTEQDAPVEGGPLPRRVDGVLERLLAGNV
jgi:aminoglycoside phosphotransferase